MQNTLAIAWSRGFIPLALAVVGVALSRRGARVVPIIALVVSLLPGIFILILFIAARASS